MGLLKEAFKSISIKVTLVILCGVTGGLLIAKAQNTLVLIYF